MRFSTQSALTVTVREEMYMETLVLHNTATAQWHALVNEAEHRCNAKLGEELESYLVFLLMRNINAASIANRILALDYLNGLEIHGRLREAQLRDVGDNCLLYSGLFPGRAERRRVRISYYVELGMSAYSIVGESLAGMKAKIFAQLAEHFVALMDVLQATRDISHTQPSLQPLQAMELWNDTGSPYAYATLSQYTSSTPVKTELPADTMPYHRIVPSCAFNTTQH